jgi:RHS repeat-associated protein
MIDHRSEVVNFFLKVSARRRLTQGMKAFWGTVLVVVHVSSGSISAVQFSANPSPEEFLKVRVFDEPLVPTGGSPGAAENAALASALVAFSQRATADDFSSLIAFLQNHPRSAWKPALLASLGLEYYKAAYYSRALDAWQEAWALGRNATDISGKFLGDRAACELAGLYSRLGRMTELEALLKLTEARTFVGGATERIIQAREALWMMQNKPGVSFRCGPLALQRILLSDQGLLTSAATNAMMEIFNSASTQQGFSLPQVAELSKQIGLNYQMAFREKAGDFVIPSVVHWKVGHYAALVRKVGDQYLLEDPTFGNRAWATRRALETETSGYFLVPPGDLPEGWRRVNAKEGAIIWGKGVTGSSDDDAYTKTDMQTGNCGGPGVEASVGGLPSAGNPFPFGGGSVQPADGAGMAVSSVHLMMANLQLKDTPVGYAPPVGPPVRFTVRYNHRDYLQQVFVAGTNAYVSILGPKWTHDWDGRIRDNPNNPLADVKYLVEGGGARTFTGFNTNTQTFAPQQHDQTQLRRIGSGLAATYEITFPDGSRRIFGLRRGLGVDVLLTQVLDSAGNAVTLSYDSFQRLVGITDAIGQVTTISYEDPDNVDLITRVTDPFGRFATFDYYTNAVGGWVFRGTCGTNLTVEPIFIPRLRQITDVLGLTSSVVYETKIVTNIAYDPIANVHCTNRYNYTGDTITFLGTPYGATTFMTGQGPPANFTMRFVETRYPDGSRDRVEYNQAENLGIPNAEPASAIPQGMATLNTFMYARNTFYWSRNAAANAYGDYRKARIYHWLHAENVTMTAGILESVKAPLERRIWYDYKGQNGPYVVGPIDKPWHIGRVLDDGTTQLHTFEHNSFGHVTNSVDPLGRRLSLIYDSSGIDLLEIRQTRAGNNELLFSATYNSQHRPLTTVDVAGQTNRYSYNARGQLLTRTNPKSETTTYVYDANGYLTAVDGPLPGTSDIVTATYDAFGRIQTLTMPSGYVAAFNYDSMDRLTRITHPDSTFSEFTYNRLDLVTLRDRAGRQTMLEYDSVRQITKETDPLGRITRFSWCDCGSLKSLIDPMGRVTEWHSDIQSRPISKRYSDGSRISYDYEETTSRVRQIIDEKQQITQFLYNQDNTIKSISYANAVVPTPAILYTYDTNYQRVISMADGVGTTLYSYYPITGSPALGAGQLAAIDGPLPNDTITHSYDELGRSLATAIDGVASGVTYDPVGRITAETNALGGFAYGYEGPSHRMTSLTFPNNQTEERGYLNNLQDRMLQRITHTVNATPISEFLYSHDVTAGRITAWSQQIGGQSPNLHTFGYDAVNQLLGVTNGGAPAETIAYTYDLAGNRPFEQVGGSTHFATYNPLNQVGARTGPGMPRTNEWDAEDRLVAVTVGNQRTEFTYDGYDRRVGIRQLVNGSEVSHRRFVWCENEICEERDATGAVVKRYFSEGVKVESGPVTGTFYYTRDHLGSIREVTDSNGNVRARYVYDPYGRRTKLTGDVDADFGFAGMFWSPEVNLSLTLYRAYDPELGRWLSRDPLAGAEISQGPNLYAYVANDPVNGVDPSGLGRWGLMHDYDYELFSKVMGKGEIVEVVDDFDLKPAPKRPGGEMMIRPKGEIMVRPKLEVEKWTPRVRRPYPAPPLRVRPHAPRIPRPAPAPRTPGVGGVFVDMGMTVLTMANCDVAEGISALMRVRRGELANKYENQMMKELQKDLW